MSEDKFLNIKVVLTDKETYDRDLDADLHIDKNSLEDELVSQAGKFAWWATLSELARDKFNRLKSDLEIFEATASQLLRSEKSSRNEKITESGLIELLRMLPEWQAKKNAVLEAQKQAGVLDAAREAFDHRKYMLRALSAESGRPVDLSVMRAVAEETIRGKK